MNSIENRGGADKLARPIFLMFIAGTVGGACNYFYQIIMGRMLGVENYSELAAVISLFYVFSIPTAAITTTIAKFSADYSAREENGKIAWLLLRSTRISVVVGFVMSFVMFLFNPALKEFLSLDSDIPLLILEVGVFLTIVLSIASGGIQGVQKFRYLGMSNILSPLTKLGMAILLVFVGFGVGGAMAGVVIAYIVTALVSFAGLRDNFKHRPEKGEHTAILRYLVPTTCAITGFTVLTNVDTIFARHHLDSFDAGLFSAASMLGRIILFLPGAITLVMFPKISSAHASGQNTTALLKKTLIITLGLCGLVAGGFYLLPELTISILYGSSYVGAADALQICGVAMALFSLVNLFMTYSLAVNDYVYVWIIVAATVVEILLFNLFNSSPLIFAMDMLVAGILAVGASFAWLMYSHWSRRQALV